MIEIRHLHLIQQIAATGNMTRASEKLFLTQPSLSHQLKEIESRLGAQLFLRVNKTLVLTEAGKKILQAAADILPKLELVEQEIVRGKEGTQVLRISTLCYTCYHWLPQLMRKFQSYHNQVEFDVVTEAMNRPIDYLLEDKIDVAIVNTKTSEKGVYFEKLFDDEQILLVPKNHPLAKKDYVVPSDFKAEHLVIYKENFDSDYFAKHVLIPAGVTPRRVTKMQLTEARVELVKAGLGITVLSRWLVKPFVHKAAELTAIKITRKGFYRTWFIAALTQKRKEHHIQQFVAYLKEQQLGTPAMLE